MTTTEPLLADLNYELDPEGMARLDTLITLVQMRGVLERQGWRQEELWADQDAPYPGQGSVCLLGAEAVVLGKANMSGTDYDLTEVLDSHPVTVALDDTLRDEYPNGGREDMRFGSDHRDHDFHWTRVLEPGDRVAHWNDYTGRTKREVLALIDRTIERLESA